MQVVAPQRVPIVFEAVGQTEGASRSRCARASRASWRSSSTRKATRCGAGAPLFHIERAPFEIALAQARARSRRKRRAASRRSARTARLKPLAQDRAISQQGIRRRAVGGAARRRRRSSRARRKVREAELNLSYTLVDAPIAGVTGRAQHSKAAWSRTERRGSLLTTLTQVNPIWVRFCLVRIRFREDPVRPRRAGGRPRCSSILPDGTPLSGKGRLNFAATAVDRRLGTVQMRAEFANPKLQLLPGQFVRVQVIAGTRDNVVPRAAGRGAADRDRRFCLGGRRRRQGGAAHA